MPADAADSDKRLRENFLAQARGCVALGSPFTGRLCEALACVLDRTSETGQKIFSWPGDPAADALALRLCGALHAIVLTGIDSVLTSAFPPNAASENVLRTLLPTVIGRHDEQLARALDYLPQTNEVARAAMLLPGLLVVARETALPLALCEIGASAGLNGLLDQFGYCFGGTLHRNPDAQVQLAPQSRGRPIPLDGDLVIAAREASDRTPVDLTRPAERLRLCSFIWADQTSRMERLTAAIALAATKRLQAPTKADAAAAVRRWLGQRPEGTAGVLFHSIVWQYLPAETKRQVALAMERSGAEATDRNPLAWLRMEPPNAASAFAALNLTIWPDGASRNLADCDYHGRWIVWH